MHIGITLYHLVVLYINAYSLIWDIYYYKDKNGETFIYYQGYAGKFKYLTFYSQVYFSISFPLNKYN